MTIVSRYFVEYKRALAMAFHIKRIFSNNTRKPKQQLQQKHATSGTTQSNSTMARNDFGNAKHLRLSSSSVFFVALNFIGHIISIWDSVQFDQSL